MGARAEHRWQAMLAREARGRERVAHHREVTGQIAVTIAAAAMAITEGHVLHVRADRLAGRRHPKRDAMPAVDCTVGPAARGGFLVIDYSRIRSGEEERHETAEEAVRAVRKLLGWDRLRALRAAVTRTCPPEAPPVDVEAIRYLPYRRSLAAALIYRRMERG